MNKKLLTISVFVLLSGLFVSVAMACGCGKKAGAGSCQSASCGGQCCGGCSEQSACSDKPLTLAMGSTPEKKKEVESKPVQEVIEGSPEQIPVTSEIIPEEIPAAVEIPIGVPATETPVEVGNKICPVSGDKVGEMGEIVKYEYKGKTYNLCCKMCIKDFENDPEKFSKIADEEGRAGAE